MNILHMLFTKMCEYLVVCVKVNLGGINDTSATHSDGDVLAGASEIVLVGRLFSWTPVLVEDGY